MEMGGRKKFIVEIEEAKEEKDGKPSVGPVYRNVLVKDGFRPLPEGLESCWDSFCQSVKKYSNNLMLGEREMVEGKAGGYVWLTYKEVHDLVLQVGASIRSCGVMQGGRCGIYGANCSRWVISMQACNAHGLYCVPLYDTLGVETFPSTENYLKTIVSFGEVTPQQKQVAGNFGSQIYSWNEFLLLGMNKQFDIPVKKKTDICTIMYTSGTTGDPKGVMISNESILSIISGVNHHLESMNQEFSETDVFLSYLPLAHIFDRVIEELFISKGASIGFWHKDIKQLLDDIKELKPTVLCAVPRVLDRIYAGLVGKLSSAGVLRHTLFNAAYSYKLRYMSKGYKHVEAAPLLDKLIFNKVKEGLGGNLRLILSGAAPLLSSVETFLRVVTCAHVLQGYGLTETCAASFVARPDDLAMINTVGPPLPVVDICLESVPEMGYDALSRTTPRGEICIRGKCLFSGYYKRDDLTKEVMTDRWFHTGDIGEWQPDGSMKIIDRKKNIFKLSQGEYVSVENLESIYSISSSIDALRILSRCCCQPNIESLKQWAEVNEVSEDFSTICEDPRARKYILGELTKIGKETKLRGFEFIKAVHLDPIPFDMERDLLTPTYKKKGTNFTSIIRSHRRYVQEHQMSNLMMFNPLRSTKESTTKNEKKTVASAEERMLLVALPEIVE
ncbi:UNVERIFIED_CONTAM: Long chain acyl-CoA synthetase 4 [Sesamum latifolium]|uniref:Long chain acyl-CoA synthetase 4 n=1 Tax=Sesamum latifolium TaxID=2727402 RepID=A0AAW2YGG0_9LAMI